MRFKKKPLETMTSIGIRKKPIFYKTIKKPLQKIQNFSLILL